jgi:hypothetical protein
LAGSARWQFRYQRWNTSRAERHPVTSLGDKLLFGAPMPSPLGKVPPKGADEVCNFAKQNCIAAGNNYCFPSEIPKT